MPSRATPVRNGLVGLAAILVLAGCGTGDEATPGSRAGASSATGAPTSETTAPRTASQPAPSPPERPPLPEEHATVIDVVDGDTVDVLTAAGTVLTVRVLGIDTPETHGGTECWGPEATAFAVDTLSGRTVNLVADPTQDGVDRYGRSLRYLILPEGSNYSVLAARAGAASSYVYDRPVSEYAAIAAAEDRARAAGAGLWGPPCEGDEAPAREPAAVGGCHPSYDPCVPPSPPDLDCADLDGPIRVSGDDPHRLDGDGDGAACGS